MNSEIWNLMERFLKRIYFNSRINIIIHVCMYCVIYCECFVLDLFLRLYVLLLIVLFNCGLHTVLIVWEVLLGLLIKLLFRPKFGVVELIKLSEMLLILLVSVFKLLC